MQGRHLLDRWLADDHFDSVPNSSRSALSSVARLGLPFPIAVHRDNVCGLQFHPEKSQGAGLRLLANFVQWDGTA